MGAVSYLLFDRGARAMGGAIGVVLLSIFTAAVITLPSRPTTGAGILAHAPTVNRALKGDRLPIGLDLRSTPADMAPTPPKSLSRAQIPLGCDAAFSPIAAPLLAHVFRRCMA
jgi:hypothetical protein